MPTPEEQQMLAEQDAASPAPNQDMTAPDGGMGGGITQASPDEQAVLERFETRMFELVHNQQMRARVVDMLDGGEGGQEGDDPVKGLAMATEMIFSRVAEAAQQAGQPLPGSVALRCGVSTLEELAEMSRAAGIKDYAEDPDALEKAWFDALEMHRDKLQKSGQLDQALYAKDLEELQSLDENGMLDKLMRDLAANDEAGQAGGQEPPPAKGKPRGFGAVEA